MWDLSTNEIADVIIKSLCEKSFSIFLTTFSGSGIHEADVFGINKLGYMYEFEIKRSRSDFLNEFKNKAFKHNRMKLGDGLHSYDEWIKGRRTGNKITKIVLPNKYLFVCKEGLIRLDEVPSYAGLLYINEKRDLIEIKPPIFIHKNKADLSIYQRVATTLSQRIIYGCSYYTYKHKKK